jgi:hypothetical protein
LPQGKIPCAKMLLLREDRHDGAGAKAKGSDPNRLGEPRLGCCGTWWREGRHPYSAGEEQTTTRCVGPEVGLSSFLSVTSLRGEPGRTRAKPRDESSHGVCAARSTQMSADWRDLGALPRKANGQTEEAIFSALATVIQFGSESSQAFTEMQVERPICPGTSASNSAAQCAGSIEREH